MTFTIKGLLDKLTYLIAFIILSGMLSSESTDEKVYIAVGIYLMIWALFTILEGRILINKVTLLISCIFLGVWAYGVLIGFINGNNRAMLIRNFAGIVLYLISIALCSANSNRIKMANIILLLSTAVSILSVLVYIDWNILHWKLTAHIPIINSYIAHDNKNATRLGFIQYYTYRICYVSYAFSLYKIISEKKFYKWHVINVVLITTATVFLYDSGADLLILVSVPVILLIAFRNHLDKKMAFWVVIGTAALMLIYLTLPVSLVEYVFSPDDIGNKRRYFEIESILHQLNFWGKGLGAPLGEAGSYGLINYGTELIYLNLIHKFGVVSVLLFGIYGYTLVKGYRFLRSGNLPGAYKVIPLACMTYLIESLANPLLFAASSVFLHAFSLLLLSESRICKG